MVIGAGLAGSEVALQLALRGHRVVLHEMKPKQRTPAQVSDGYAELVCSNSFRSSALENAVGVIKEEMRRLGGVLIRVADHTRVPAGDALAVDRERFSRIVTHLLQNTPGIEVVEREVTELPGPSEASLVAVATGPLTAPKLAEHIGAITGGGASLYFYDAIAPIVAADSIDENIAYRASRYGKGNADDYVNCPLDREQYEAFVQAVLEADRVTAREFEDALFFEGCLPIEVIAGRGPETLRFGCMKPVGLEHPVTGKRAHAVVQLRAENVDRTAYNLVGFQTRLKWGDQTRILRTIPGLENAEFLRLGQIHRNTYLDSPALLDEQLRLRSAPHVRFAGQMTGVEGYVESTASGLLTAFSMISELSGRVFSPPPVETALGALHAHVLGSRRPEGVKGHVPSNVHWGMVPPLDVRAKKRDRKRAYGERALLETEAYQLRMRDELGLLDAERIEAQIALALQKEELVPPAASE
jgi:methylenetetrahydrofolate--tRNA-(uracil-5-)-methyltransferase